MTVPAGEVIMASSNLTTNLKKRLLYYYILLIKSHMSTHTDMSESRSVAQRDINGQFTVFTLTLCLVIM